MTVSIVARDPASGDLGVATASFVLAVGSHVPVLAPGIGAAVVQAGSPREWRARLLEVLAAGASAREALQRLLEGGDAAQGQVAIVDCRGGIAVHSGGRLEPEFGDAKGVGICVAANLMERQGVAPKALAAYEVSETASLGGRLLDALVAADRLGGDLRGRQSAALRVVSPTDVADDGADLRVDDAWDPVGELGRLHRVWEATQLLRASRGVDGLYEDVDRALAAIAIAPDDQACLAGAAFALLRVGRTAQATPLLRRLTTLEPRTPLRIQRLIAAGLLDAEPAREALDSLPSAPPINPTPPQATRPGNTRNEHHD